MNSDVWSQNKAAGDSPGSIQPEHLVESATGRYPVRLWRERLPYSDQAGPDTHLASPTRVRSLLADSGRIDRSIAVGTISLRACDVVAEGIMQPADSRDRTEAPAAATSGVVDDGRPIEFNGAEAVCPGAMGRVRLRIAIVHHTP